MTTFAEEPALLPEAPERVAQAKPDLRLVSRNGPGQRGPVVVVVARDVVAALVRLEQRGFELLSPSEEVGGVTSALDLVFACFDEALEGELSDRLEHREPGLAPFALITPEEALLGQAADRIVRSDGRIVELENGRCGGEGEAAHEHAETSQSGLIDWIKEPVTPIDCAR